MNSQVTSHQQYAMLPQVRSTTHSSPATPTEKYKTVLFNLGISEIVLGGISCLLGIVTLLFGGYYGGLVYVAHGIWCGLVLVASGILGVAARSKPTKCMYNANMAMSIVSANFMVVLVILSSMTAAFDADGAMIAFHIIIALAGFAGLVVTIVHSAYCCAGVCCVGNASAQMFIVPPQAMVPVQMNNGQVVLCPYPATYPAPYSRQGNPVVSMPQFQHTSAAQPMQFPQATVAQPMQFPQATVAQPMQFPQASAAQPMQFPQGASAQPMQFQQVPPTQPLQPSSSNPIVQSGGSTSAQTPIYNNDEPPAYDCNPVYTK